MISSTTCRGSNKKRICVLVGIHSSGKSTLGRKLQEKGACFFPEIGKSMRLQGNRSVVEPQRDFDLMVLQRELLRDSNEITRSKYPVIESWHIGNYAFAKARNSHLEEEYRACFDKQLSAFYPIVIRLQISDQEFLARHSEQHISSLESLRFYRKVDSHLEETCKKLQSAKLATILCYENDAPESLMNLIRRELDSEG